MPRKCCSAAAGIPDFPGTEGGAGPMDLEQTAIERLVYVADLGQIMLAKLTPGREETR